MYKRKVGHVEKIFDHSRAVRPEQIRSSEYLAERIIIAGGELRNLASRSSQANPDQSISFPDMKDIRARLLWRRQRCLRRNPNALPGGVVLPGMIGTNQAVFFHLSQRKTRSWVHA